MKNWSWDMLDKFSEPVNKMMGKKKPLSRKHYISFYDILIWSNWAVLCLVVFGFDNDTLYTNGFTKILSAFLCVVIHFILNDARKNCNPLLCITAFELIFFYQLGVFSIGWSGIASYLDEANATPRDLNLTLIFIICATILMWKGMHFNKHEICSRSDFQPSRKFKVMSIIVFVSLLFLYLGNIPGLSYLQAFVLLVFNVPGLLLFLYSYYIRNSNILPKKSLLVVIAASLLLILIKTLGGSRSGFLVVFMLLISALLVENRVLFKGKYVILGVVLVPVMVFFYTYSSYLRMTESTFSNTQDKIEMVSVVADNMSGDDLKTVLAPIVGRMSYLDGTCVSIKLEEGFSSFINPVYCIKSIVDNVLTPGFDVFDTPRMSLCMRFYHNHQTNVKKSQSADMEYQSDVFTLYGEQFVMFRGWLGLIGIYLICAYFKVLYLRFRHKDNYMLMAALVYLFSVVFNSYGLDWFFLDVVSMMFSYYIVQFVLKKMNLGHR